MALGVARAGVCLLAATIALAQGASIAIAQITEAQQTQVRRMPQLDFQSYGLSLDPVDRKALVSGTSAVYALTRGEVDVGWDSNVRRSNDDTVSSAVTRFRPGVSLRVDGIDGEAYATFEAAATRYANSARDAHDDLEMRTGGRWLISDLTSVLGGVEVGRFHTDRGGDADPGPDFEVQTYQRYAINGRFESAEWLELPTRIDGNLSRLFYNSVDGIDRDGFDRWIGDLRARVGLGAARGGDLVFFVQPGVIHTNYIEEDAFGADSTRLDLAGGAIWQVSAISSVEGFAGLSRRSFAATGVDAELSALVGVDATWNVTPLVTVRSGLSIANQDTELATSNSKLVSDWRGAVDYSPLENVILGASLRFTNEAFDGADADQRYVAGGLDANYLLNENLYIGAQLGHERQTSDSAANEYTATTAMIRFGVQLCCLRDRVDPNDLTSGARPERLYGIFR
ncbi:MAG: outer membrane beta-barrel protein [Alphaproteobacteria bacterium]|nr:outer membrane beta-barrel protein [Alphaproteobacteria bacterium]